MRITPILFVLVFSCMMLTSQVQAQSNKTILVALAHPDDETAMGAMLYEMAKTNKVILLIATDGRYGFREHIGIKDSDSLAAKRKSELRCSVSTLGLDSLIQLGYHDGFGVRTSVGEYFTQTARMKEEIKSIIEQVEPNFIISFGPDGDTGHGDHRNISNLVTEIILCEGWYYRFPLYYLAWTKEQSEHFGSVNYMHLDYLNISYPLTAEGKLKNQQATACHQSQFTTEELQGMKKADETDTTNKLFFRRFTVSKGIRRGFE